MKEFRIRGYAQPLRHRYLPTNRLVGHRTEQGRNISLTDHNKGATQKYDAFFVATKDGRILLLKNPDGNITLLINAKKQKSITETLSYLFVYPY